MSAWCQGLCQKSKHQVVLSGPIGVCLYHQPTKSNLEDLPCLHLLLPAFAGLHGFPGKILGLGVRPNWFRMPHLCSAVMWLLITNVLSSCKEEDAGTFCRWTECVCERSTGDIVKASYLCGGCSEPLHPLVFPRLRHISGHSIPVISFTFL